MKKILSCVIAGSTFFTVVTNTKQVLSETGTDYAGRCDKAPATGDKFVITGPDSWKIRSTVVLPIKSQNERKVAFAFKRLELEAQKQLVQLIHLIEVGPELNEFNQMESISIKLFSFD